MQVAHHLQRGESQIDSIDERDEVTEVAEARRVSATPNWGTVPSRSPVAGLPTAAVPPFSAESQVPLT